MGKNHIPYAGTRVVALCDVDKNHLQEALNMVNNGAKLFSDYRELIQLPEVVYSARGYSAALARHYSCRCRKSRQRCLVRKTHDAYHRRGQAFSGGCAAAWPHLQAQYMVPLHDNFYGWELL